MRNLLMILTLALAACFGPPENETAEEREFREAMNAARATLYLDFAEEQGDKFVATGQWDKETTDNVIQGLRTGLELWTAYKEAGEDGTVEDRVAAQAKLEKAILDAVALGLDRLTKAPEAPQ